jgi:hypothetical protein
VLCVPAAALSAIGKQDARQFAAQFTADYLSWDEDHPQWRSDTLRRYVDTTPDDTASAEVLRWRGRGRAEVDLVIPGAVTRLHRCWVVDVAARVVTYQRRADPRSGPSGRWWRSGRDWTRLHVPVGRRGDGRLAVCTAPAGTAAAWPAPTGLDGRS